MFTDKVQAFKKESDYGSSRTSPEPSFLTSDELNMSNGFSMSTTEWGPLHYDYQTASLPQFKVEDEEENQIFQSTAFEVTSTVFPVI